MLKTDRPMGLHLRSVFQDCLPFTGLLPLSWENDSSGPSWIKHLHGGLLPLSPFVSVTMNNILNRSVPHLSHQ